MSQRFSDVCDSLILNTPSPSSPKSRGLQAPTYRQHQEEDLGDDHDHHLQQQQQRPQFRQPPQPSPPRPIQQQRRHAGGGGGGLWAVGNQGMSYSHLGPPGVLAGSAPASLCRQESAPPR
ncbi:hypothetical protein PoB_000388400 [Plakobranchus ocellatus]|uniref:Uncharacterized protein n=1 Tax=Plakobranchus ocellatus TaxID=259542 RepID=A0AAV3Y5M5_9GAST|nr:hypothetical protein PoB_000388400 [Plakobranchus ocellatus]